MHPKNHKIRRTKMVLTKSQGVVKAFGPIMAAYAPELDRDSSIVSVESNVPFDDKTLQEYVSDFVCRKEDGELMVRECVSRKQLTYPKTCKELDASRNYWRKRGVTDWGIIIEKGEEDS